MSVVLDNVIKSFDTFSQKIGSRRDSIGESEEVSHKILKEQVLDPSAEGFKELKRLEMQRFSKPNLVPAAQVGQTEMQEIIDLFLSKYSLGGGRGENTQLKLDPKKIESAVIAKLGTGGFKDKVVEAAARFVLMGTPKDNAFSTKFTEVELATFTNALISRLNQSQDILGKANTSIQELPAASIKDAKYFTNFDQVRERNGNFVYKWFLLNSLKDILSYTLENREALKVDSFTFYQLIRDLKNFFNGNTSADEIKLDLMDFDYIGLKTPESTTLIPNIKN